MRVTHVSRAPTCIIPARDDEPQLLMGENPTPTKQKRSHSDQTLSAVRYNPPECHDGQVSPRNFVKQSDKITKTDWRKDFTLPKDYFAYSGRFINMLTQLESIWVGHLGSLMAVLHRIELGKTGKGPKHAAPYHAGPKARECERQEVNGVPDIDFIEPAQTE